MPTENMTFDLTELCDLADVTPRTVRYYVQQGLLPSPGTRGPGSRYDRGHLARLQLIRRLQRDHLPLAEIRHRLAELDDSGVSEALQETPRSSPGGSALDYVQDVLAGRTSSAAQSAAPSGPMSGWSPPGAAVVRQQVPRLSQAPEEAGPERSTWERVILAPDIELHVRRPLSRAQNKLVDRLVEHARTLFLEER